MALLYSGRFGNVCGSSRKGDTPVKLVEPGIQSPSEVFFHTAGTEAKSMLFYITCTGHYFCQSGYRVLRPRYDGYLLLLCLGGKGVVVENGSEIPVGTGDLVLLDCHGPHHYYADGDWEFVWLHFDGVLARRYYESVHAGGTVLRPTNGREAESAMLAVYRMFHEGVTVNEIVISKEITVVLTEMLLAANRGARGGGDGATVSRAIRYIGDRVHERISIGELARLTSVSPYYFIRLFKRETGYTPHEYMVLSRVNRASFLLRNSGLSVEEIGAQCGFSNIGAFCTVFKRYMKVSPLQYRKSNSYSLAELGESPIIKPSNPPK